MADTVFTIFGEEDQVVATPSRITNAMWSNGVGILTRFTESAGFTSESSIGNSRYYADIYASAPATEQVEFSLAYGDVSGAGAPSTDLDYPTKAIYGQYRNLLLDNASGQFILNTTGPVTMSQFYAISMKRANLKQKLDPGNWELHLGGMSAAPSLSLIDNSADSNDTNAGSTARSYKVVSGSVTAGQVGTAIYGLVYPDYGVILIDPTAISASTQIPFTHGTTQWTGSSNAYNNIHNLFLGIASCSYFAARSEEKISSTHYFVRVKNQQYNYSSNPTFYSASDGTIIQQAFFNDPQVFLTTVGLYNDTNELLAVAKLSQPVTKGFDKEALIKVRLDF